MTASGPLQGLRVLEFAGLGPAPFACMLLSDLGAQVLRISRANDAWNQRMGAVLDRGRITLSLDIKRPQDLEVSRSLAARADVLIEGFRPGVMERLGLGPTELLNENPKLIYGRMTGWGQSGPRARDAGHDINYISLSGALHAIGESGKPVPPLNLVGDFGGGALYLVTGILAALLRARATGMGQVVDCAMTDGAASLMSMAFALQSHGDWTEQRGNNLLDGGAPFYDTYRCADGHWISIGALEPQFFHLLLAKLGIPVKEFPDHMNRECWPSLRRKLESTFLMKDRAQWCDLLEHTDTCFAPVLSMREAAIHPHNEARRTFVEHAGILQPAPAPRFSNTPGAIQSSSCANAATLREWELPENLIDYLGARLVS